MSKTVAFIQARMSSARLAGKVVAPLAGRPLLAFMVERVRKSKLLDDVIVLTSVDPSDDALVSMLVERDIPVFRGNLNDVLKRFADAAEVYNADTIVRLTGDCPLIDPAIIDEVVRELKASGADYASNVAPPTFPDGLDVECFSRSALDLANQRATRLADREHVTLWMRSAEADLRTANVAAITDCSHIRLTIDHADDLDAVRDIVKILDCADNSFDLYDILRCLAKRPDLAGADRHKRNEGLLTSLAQLPAGD